MTAEPGQRAPSPSPLAIARREGVVEQQAMRAGLVPMVVGKFGRDALTDRLAWSEHEAAEALGVSDRTLRTWRDRGIVPYKRIGTVVRYSPIALKDWVAKPFDDQKENQHGEGPERTPRTPRTQERPVARRAPARSRKPGAPKPRLPVGLIGGRGPAQAG